MHHRGEGSKLRIHNFQHSAKKQKCFLTLLIWKGDLRKIEKKWKKQSKNLFFAKKGQKQPKRPVLALFYTFWPNFDPKGQFFSQFFKIFTFSQIFQIFHFFQFFKIFNFSQIFQIFQFLNFFTFSQFFQNFHFFQKKYFHFFFFNFFNFLFLLIKPGNKISR